MLKHVLLTLAIAFAFSAAGYAQGGNTDWDANYPEVDISEILRYEQQYADSVKAADGNIAYYFRMGKYRFEVTYLGQKRKLDPEVMRSMKNVFKLTAGNPEQLDGLIENEYLFQVGDQQFWAPIQKQLEKPFKEEVKKGRNVLLYCLLLNERSSRGLYNTLLISEFLAE